MIISFILIGLGIFSGIIYAIERIVKKSNLSIVLKTITSFIFVILGLYSFFCSSKEGYGMLIVLGLIAGLLGDIFLALRRHIKDKSDLFLICGFASFGIGHVFYISALIIKYFSVSNIWYFIIPICIAAIVSICFTFLEKTLKLNFGSFKIAIIVYGTLLISFCLTNISICILTNMKVVNMIFMAIGGVLFAASDMFLLKKYFGGDPDNIGLTIANITTYFSAQFLIAFSLYFI